MVKTLEVGKWNKLPHYCVVGSPVDFYVYSHENFRRSWSGSVKDKEALVYWSKFLALSKRKDNAGFITLVQEIFDKYPHKGW